MGWVRCGPDLGVLGSVLVACWVVCWVACWVAIMPGRAASIVLCAFWVRCSGRAGLATRAFRLATRACWLGRRHVGSPPRGFHIDSDDWPKSPAQNDREFDSPSKSRISTPVRIPSAPKSASRLHPSPHPVCTPAPKLAHGRACAHHTAAPFDRPTAPQPSRALAGGERPLAALRPRRIQSTIAALPQLRHAKGNHPVRPLIPNL